MAQCRATSRRATRGQRVHGQLGFTEQPSCSVNAEILALLESDVPARSAELADGRRVFVKRRNDAPADFFAAEVRGLAALAAAGALRTPRVHGVAPRGIIIEDLGSGRPSAGDWETAGRGLARLHGNAAA